MPRSVLDIEYDDHASVRELVDVVRYTLEGVSLSFDRYQEELVKGPGLYVAVVVGRSVAPFADPMGKNQWPVESCPTVTDDLDAFYTAAREVSLGNDGAVVVAVDGVVCPQMVRFRDVDVSELADAPEYADWMGSRHMSAVETSLRADVVATLTLSEESGRVTTFQDGEYDSTVRSDLGDDWRVSSDA